MKRTVLTDPFFDKQPPLEFIRQLKQPLHGQKPGYYGKREKRAEEVDVQGMFLDDSLFPDPENLLETVYKDFRHFLTLYGLDGDRFPVRLEQGETPCFEAYRIQVEPQGVIITANDTEGIRRGIVYLEDMLRRKEAGYLDAGEILRQPQIKSRITRCFFSPINRPPKYGDELSDDIDYYPEEYLNRLMHDGVNGVWIYTRFSDLLPSEFILENGKGREARIEKLNRVAAKCRRYGIGVYIFAIEPYHLQPEQVKKYPAMAGALFDGLGGQCATMCMNSEQAQAYCFEQGRLLAEQVPHLRGFISITEGERATSCVTVTANNTDNFVPCPRCAGQKPGALLAKAAAALAAGFQSVNPAIEVVSWTYGHRLWDEKDIQDYVAAAPDTVRLMQNFDDMGVADQLGEDRLGVDYWLSYAGPSRLFDVTAQKAKECGKRMFAKMQVCCSHEIASIPYIPTPGLIFEKYKGAARYGVEGILQCWYFGNYPSLMSKAAGELSFMEEFSDKHGFLKSLAAIYVGESHAEAVACAYEAFEEGYINYPLNVMFSYYGPAHDGVVWDLALKPRNFSLPRSWQTLDPVDGDRICEALLTGHTLPEARELFEAVCANWRRGMAALRELPLDTEDAREFCSVASCIGILFESARNILEFYQLRDTLGCQTAEAMPLLERMRKLVCSEMENSRKMILLCEQDARLGYHSEGEGYKFFPEKLEWRIGRLQQLLATEFPEVEQRVNDGLPPLAYYLGEEDDPELKKAVMSRNGIGQADWQIIDEQKGSRFRVSCDETAFWMELESREKEEFMLCPEYRLLCPDANMILTPDGKAKLENFARNIYYQLVGQRAEKALEKYRNITVLPGIGTHLLLKLSWKELGLEKARPMKLRIVAGGSSWIQDDTSAVTLGKGQIKTGEYGWII